MLAIKEFDAVLLRDGREGTIVHIYGEPDRAPAYEVEIAGTRMELVTVRAEDVQEIVYRHS